VLGCFHFGGETSIFPKDCTSLPELDGPQSVFDAGIRGPPYMTGKSKLENLGKLRESDF
jgi:hypothetical protein